MDGIPLSMIVLDLRLWSNDADEKEILNSIVQTARSIGVGGADARLRKVVNQAQDVTRGDAIGPEVLCMLPMLLSYYDAGLPIVVFSSSHQRAITDILGFRKNIILEFVKPLVAGYDQYGGEGEALTGALRKALGMQAGRSLWMMTESIVRQGLRSNRLKAQDTARVIAHLVHGYILPSQAYDSLSLPSEFLEGRLGKIMRWGRQIEILSALRLIRHWKAHGVGWLPGARDNEYIERAAPLVCGMLLDALRRIPPNEISNHGKTIPPLPELDQKVSKDVVDAITESFEKPQLTDNRSRMLKDELRRVDFQTYSAIVFHKMLTSKVELSAALASSCYAYCAKAIQALPVRQQTN
jgi:hypothetical protein